MAGRYQAKQEALERLRSFRTLMDEPIGRLMFGDPDQERRWLGDVISELHFLQGELSEIVTLVQKARELN